MPTFWLWQGISGASFRTESAEVRNLSEFYMFRGIPESSWGGIVQEPSKMSACRQLKYYFNYIYLFI